ncbi:hypothetical protein AB0I85_08500 [Micromonospora echinofusca]|uniref:hypothetical protein n=1 Tax=Micromonospora echinofusca TaxID=47858 RepID=UPI0033CE9177
MTAPDGLSLKRDLSLVRASILYADEVELISLSASMLDVLMRLGSPDKRHLWEFLSSLTDDNFQAITRGSFPAEWKKLLPYLTGQKFDPRVAKLDQLVSEVRENVKVELDKLIQESEVEELRPALKSGIVKLVPAAPDSAIANLLTRQNTRGRNEGEMVEFLAKWAELVRWLLEDSKKRLLFDDVAGGIANSLVNQGEMQAGPLTLKHAGEAAVGSGLIARLPAFPQAPLDELLDLRSDLYAPLARYRAAVSGMATKLTVRGFDPDIAAEIDDLWITDVSPALADIEEGLAEHGLVREIGRSVGQDVKTLVPQGAALYVGFESLTTLNNWVSATAALAAPTAQAIISGTRNALAGKQNVRRKDMYYLYAIDNRFSEKP